MNARTSNSIRFGARAFTLLELLASMAILTVIVALLFSGFSQANRAWLQSENRVETFVQARAALDFISKELSQAMATTNISFLGSANSVAFIAPVSTDPTELVDIEEVVYLLNGHKLERQVSAFIDGPTWWDFYTSPQNWPTTTSLIATVAENIVSLQLDYVGTDGVFRVFWNSTTAAGWSGAIPSGSTDVRPETMTNRTPAGVVITLRVIDSRAAKRLQPGMSFTVSNNIITQAKQTFTTFVAIPSRQP